MYMTNLFEGFAQYLKRLNINPKYAAEQDLLLTAITLQPTTGGKPIEYSHGMYRFQIVRADPQQKWAVLKDVSYPDDKDQEMSDFPHALAPSPHAGKEYMVRGPQFDKLIAPRIATGGGGGF